MADGQKSDRPTLALAGLERRSRFEMERELQEATDREVGVFVCVGVH